MKNAVDGDNTKVNHPLLRVTATDTSYVWKPTLAAVFVGGPDANGKINTRRITYVAAGSADTDAVNVAQLTAATEMAGTSISLKAGDGIKLENDGSGNWTISTNYKDSGSDKVTYEEKNDNTAVPDAGGTETVIPIRGMPMRAALARISTIRERPSMPAYPLPLKRNSQLTTKAKRNLKKTASLAL